MGNEHAQNNFANYFFEKNIFSKKKIKFMCAWFEVTINTFYKCFKCNRSIWWKLKLVLHNLQQIKRKKKTTFFQCIKECSHFIFKRWSISKALIVFNLKMFSEKKPPKFANINV